MEPNEPTTATAVKTATVTNTKLMVATLALLAASGAALATAPVVTNKCSTRSVYSCQKVNGGVVVKYSRTGQAVKLFNGCVNGRYDYVYTCASKTKLKTCSGTCRPQPSYACVDDDANLNPRYGGKNIYVAATTTQTNAQTGQIINAKKDSCVASKGAGPSTRLTEYYCANSVIQTLSANCPAGFICENGACQEQNFTCGDDMDGGLNYAVWGRAERWQGNELVASTVDRCLDANSLIESYCYGNQIAEYPVRCNTILPGTICQNGACQKSAPANLTLKLDASNPAAYAVAVGSAGNTYPAGMLRVAVRAENSPVKITKLIARVLGSVGDNFSNSFKKLELYNESQLLASAPVTLMSVSDNSGQFYGAVFDFPGGVIITPNTTGTTLMVQAYFNGSDNGLESGTSPYLVLGGLNNNYDTLYARAADVNTGDALTNNQINGSEPLAVVGNDVKVYKSLPEFSFVNGGTTLVDGVENNIYSFRVTAASDSVSLKQLMFKMDIMDQGGNNPNMKCDQFKLYRGNTHINNPVLIQDPRSVSLKGTRTGPTNGFENPTGANKYFYITWLNSDEVIPANVSYTYTVKAYCSGFTDPVNNDYIRVRLENYDNKELNQTDGQEPYYLVNMTGSMMTAPSCHGTLIGLDDYVLGGNIVTSTASLIWSDRSATPHSAATTTCGATNPASSGDWFNGFLLKSFPFNYQTMTRQ